MDGLLETSILRITMKGIVCCAGQHCEAQQYAGNSRPFSTVHCMLCPLQNKDTALSGS